MGIGLSEYGKIKSLSGPNFSETVLLILLHVNLFLVKKGAWSRVKGSQSKFHKLYFRKFFLVPDDGEKLGGTFKKKSSPYHLWNSSESKNKKNISLYIRKIRSFLSSFSSHFTKQFDFGSSQIASHFGF